MKHEFGGLIGCIVALPCCDGEVWLFDAFQMPDPPLPERYILIHSLHPQRPTGSNDLAEAACWLVRPWQEWGQPGTSAIFCADDIPGCVLRLDDAGIRHALARVDQMAHVPEIKMPYVMVCEMHGEAAGVDDLENGMRLLAKPEIWCKCCAVSLDSAQTH